MIEKCPHCGAPYKYSEEINNLIEREIVTCEYCQSQFVIEPKMKKTAAAVSITRELLGNKRVEEKKSEEQIQKEKRDALVFSLVGLILIFGLIYFWGSFG